uniref:Large ribosomal subunit protein bL9m n=1 Tax=Canis lupus familiaris TaxID=9615 RepID=A0A8I3NG76_CANLF
MHREPDVGFDPGSPGSRPRPKAGAKPLRHPGIPIFRTFFYDRDLSLSHSRGAVVVERRWQVPLAGEGGKLVEDTKHGPRGSLELILTRSVEGLGVRGDLGSVKKSLGRNRLPPPGLAVYASPENKKLFEEEKLLRQEGKLEKVQTRTVARHFFKNLGVVVAPQALKLPEEPITRWGESRCEGTVNGLDAVRVPMSVVNFERPKTKRYKCWLAQQAAKGMAPTNSQTI